MRLIFRIPWKESYFFYVYIIIQISKCGSLLSLHDDSQNQQNSILKNLNVIQLEIATLPGLVLLWLQICLQWGTSRLIGRSEEIGKTKRPFGFRKQMERFSDCWVFEAFRHTFFLKRRKVWIVILFCCCMIGWLSDIWTENHIYKKKLCPPSSSICFLCTQFMNFLSGNHITANLSLAWNLEKGSSHQNLHVLHSWSVDFQWV